MYNQSQTCNFYVVKTTIQTVLVDLNMFLPLGYGQIKKNDIEQICQYFK